MDSSSAFSGGSRRGFLAGVGCVAAATLLDGCSLAPWPVVPVAAGPVSLPAGLADALNHFIVTGQSLSCGQMGAPPLSTVQPFANKMISLPATTTYQSSPVNYNAVTKGKSGESLIPLVNGPSLNGKGVGVETISNGFADSLTARVKASYAAPNDFNQLLSCSGVGGYGYVKLAGPTDDPPEGTAPFQEMMSQVALGSSLAKAAGLGYNVPAMLLIHGEGDTVNPEYATNLVTWQADMQKGVNAITGRNDVIPMIAAQTQCKPISVGAGNTMPFSAGAGPLGTLMAAMENPGLICIACPEYLMAHGSVHMTGDGYRHLGSMMAKAAYQIVVEGKWWWPLMPLTTTMSGTEIKIEYKVPYGPIVLDTEVVSDPGNFGFNFADGEATKSDPGAKIADVAVTGPAEITITLSKATSAGMLSYALVTPSKDTTPEGQGYGPQAGPRGCVRDSDPMVSYYNDSATGKPYPLQNYSIAWQAAV
jgi:hypothetical protein